MKNLICITAVITLVGLGQFCGNSDRGGREKKPSAYPQELINALGKADTLDLNIKIKTITDALDAYSAEHNQYPETLDMLMPEYLQTENALIDPWGTHFKLDFDDTGNLVLISAGKDKRFGNVDDIKRRI